VQGFLRELRAPVATALSVAGVTALVGSAILSWMKLAKLELKVDQAQESVKDLSSRVDEKLNRFLRQSTNERWFDRIVMGLGAAALYMAAKP
jgi:hypothetical protein